MSEDTFRGYPPYGAPRYTMVPNAIFDEQLQDFGMAELKVLLIIVRRTFGWGKNADAISLSQLTDDTGLSRQSVSTATQQLEARGCILIERQQAPDGGKATNIYRLHIAQDSQVKPPGG